MESLFSKQLALSDSVTITSPQIHPNPDPRPESPLGSGEGTFFLLILVTLKHFMISIYPSSVSLKNILDSLDILDTQCYRT